MEIELQPRRTELFRAAVGPWNCPTTVFERNSRELRPPFALLEDETASGGNQLGKSGGGPPHSKTLARRTNELKIREAS